MTLTKSLAMRGPAMAPRLPLAEIAGRTKPIETELVELARVLAK